MNATRLFADFAKASSQKMAIVTAGVEALSFLELASLAGGMQHELRTMGLKMGDKALVMATPSPSLYACALALMGLGVSIVFVEPWMPLKNISHVVSLSKPKLYVSNLFGFLWGSRIKEIRNIKAWTTLSALTRKAAGREFTICDVEPDLPGIITFTTGTTGSPKGVVRSQGYLINQHEVLKESLGLQDDHGCDLTIFANFVFSNLARGATSLLMPTQWSKRNFQRIDAKACVFKPSTTTCGPAFLLQAMTLGHFKSLSHIHVGGALTDCRIFETAFAKWPEAHFLHVYGSSEAEPVACADAKESVAISKSRGFFQTVFFGQPVTQAKISCENDTIWVSGRHVCPLYLGNHLENQRYKRLDHHGVLWHDMGDRLTMDDRGLWYQGRSSQLKDDFMLEQKLYTDAQSSKSFIKRTKSGEVVWLGENLGRMQSVASNHSQISRVVKTDIIRDRRHRARIDRARSTPHHIKELGDYRA